MYGRLLLGLVAWAVLLVVLVVADRLLPGLRVDDLLAAAGAAALIGLLIVVVWPALILLLQRANFIVFTLACLTLNGLLIVAAGALLPGLYLDGPATGLVATAALALGITGFAALVGFHDADYYTRSLTRRIVRRLGPVEPTDAPGLICLEIDGLAEAILRRALRDGHMPNLARWLERGSHRLVGWECDLPSQTSASQAGILHGNNADIPAFRWCEKDARRVLVSNHPRDSAAIEARITDGRGLLSQGGAARADMFSGDAPRAMLTFSTVLDQQRNRSEDYVFYFANPLNLARTLSLALWDIAIEITCAWAQRLGDVRPRGHRGGVYPLVRAFTTTVLRDMTIDTLIADMYRAVPAAYATFVGYDEVAHHSGITAPDVFGVLRRLDEQFARLERAARDAPRPYEFVVLSDHGQSQGATFKQRYGFSLGELVRRLMAAGTPVMQLAQDTEHWGYLNAFLTEAIQGRDHPLRRLARGAVAGRAASGDVRLGPTDAEHQQKQAAARDAAATVLASGNLGLVYFNAWPERLSYERITVAYPAVLPGLVAHPGVGFVLMRSEAHGPLAIGRAGTAYLAADRVEGEDPLAGFGPHARAHLLRIDTFAHTPDILVNSFYDPAADEVAAFEELVGSHGGLGGTQMRPFLLYPTHLPLPAGEIVGAETLYRILAGWRARLQRPAAATVPAD